VSWNLNSVSLKVRPDIHIFPRIRVVLLIGFLGLLGLLGFAGFYAMHTLRSVAQVDDQNTRDFVRRSDALEEIRGNAYVTNSRIRDFLLDPNVESAAEHRRAAFRSWDQAMIALEGFRRLDPAAATSAFQQLQESLRVYWAAAAPALEWAPRQRVELGYDLLADQVSPKRDEFLRLLDVMRRENEIRLRADTRHSAAVIAGLRDHLTKVMILALLLGALLAAVTWVQFVRLEREADQRYRASLEAGARLEALSARLLEIQEEERRRISRELHDEAGQALSGLLVDLANVSAELAGAPGVIGERLESIRRGAESTLASIRNLSLLLRPSMLDDLGLIPALRWQARETERRTGMRVAVATDDQGIELPDEYRTTIYRVVQEALTNAARHSKAQTVSILVRSEATRLIVVIQDDGIGFDSSQSKGMGLLGMYERIAHLRGNFEIESEPGQGVVLRIELPPVAPGRVEEDRL
jgi:signal transduction histidine kinase